MGPRAHNDLNWPVLCSRLVDSVTEFDSEASPMIAVHNRQRQSTPPTEHEVDCRNMGTLSGRLEVGTQADQGTEPA